jgi:PII-like signaling protein
MFFPVLLEDLLVDTIIIDKIVRYLSHTSIRINEVHKGIVGFDDSKLRREEELEALPREAVWMRPLAA